MPKTDIVSAQWLAEQMLRVANAEPNNQSALNRGVDRAELVSYADAVSKYVNETRSLESGHDGFIENPSQRVGMMA